MRRGAKKAAKILDKTPTHSAGQDLASATRPLKAVMKSGETARSRFAKLPFPAGEIPKGEVPNLSCATPPAWIPEVSPPWQEPFQELPNPFQKNSE
jgi:hypothetical protein